MRKNIYIIGAGDLGRELESWLENLPDFNENYLIKGYLDSNLNSLKNKPSDYKVIGTLTDFEFKQNDNVLIAISNPQVRKRIANSLKNKVNFFKYVAPNTTLGKFTNIGEGSIICPNCFISTNTQIKDFVIVNAGSVIGHDCIINSYSSLMASVDVGGNVNIGEEVFIGTKATIVPGKSIASNIIIGAGSLVIRSLKKVGSYFGNPAKFFGKY